MKTIDIETLVSVCGGAGTISLGETLAWRNGMARRAPRTGTPAPFPTRIPSNTSLGEMSAWRSGMDQGGHQKK
jgi:hypothetical protein